MKAILRWLPSAVDGRVRALAIATLVSQILIVGSGGAVRLTGSGLGCPTWPSCTDASLIATPEMGIHGVIEFGNRLFSIIVGFIALAMVLAVIRYRKDRRDLFGLSVLVLAGTVIQGFIGGLSVRVSLDPSVVGLHFAISAALVALSAALVYRALNGTKEELTAPRWYVLLAYLTAVLVAVTIAVGILTTGSGPHAGDNASARNGLDPALLQHVHSWPAYALFVATIALVIGAYRSSEPRALRFALVLLALELAQIVIGIAQSRLGLPQVLVGIHMVLACCLAAAMTAVVLSMRQPVPTPIGSADKIERGVASAPPRS